MPVPEEEKENFEKYVQAQKAEPHNPAAGLSYLFLNWIRLKSRIPENEKREIFWITINPKPEVSLIKFKETIENRLSNRVFMKGAIYTYEIRSHEKPYKGIHCHMLVDKHMSPKQMHDRVYNTVKGLVGNKKCVDIRSYPYSLREEKLDYLNGKKWDSEKDPAVKATLLWRVQEGLHNIYEA